ncbi:MAG: hypothetical protein V1821_02575 [bacterium]
MEAVKKQERKKPKVLKTADRAKVLGNIPKPGRDFVDCCYTQCTRC